MTRPAPETPRRCGTCLNRTVRRAVEHMSHGGELRIYIGAGAFCHNAPRIGSGVIISDMGRLSVSRLTIKRLRKIGTERHLKNYKYSPDGDREKDTFEAWETMKDCPAWTPREQAHDR